MRFTRMFAALLILAASALAADWPGWRGPLHTGVAPTDEKLVDDPAKAKQLWLSDAELPGARVADGRKVVAASGLPHISGGFASPVYADGRVYLFYTVPNGEGDAYDHRLYEKHQPGGYGKEKWWIDTDEVIHCFDATTGKTLWKRVFEKKGMNYNLFNKGGPCNLTPHVHAGRVYAVGSAGKVYCVDAKTGAPIWDSDIGERHTRQEKLRKICHEQRVIPQYNRDLSATCVVADGVLVTSDFLGYKVQNPVREFNWSDSCGLVGFDTKTGKRLWHLPKTLHNWASPTVWTHGEKQYILAGSRTIHLVDPAKGEILWKVETEDSQQTLVAAGQYLIGTADGTLACWKISPDGAERAWTINAGYGKPTTIPVIHAGHVYTAVKSGKLLCVELATGNIVGKADVNIGGFLVLMGDRLFADVELGHGGDQVYMFDIDPRSPKNFKPMGHVWPAPNATAYMNPLTPACFDGRMVFRIEGGRLACYDLRAAHAHDEPQQVETLESAAPAERKKPVVEDLPRQPPPDDPFAKPADTDADPAADLMDLTP